MIYNTKLQLSCKNKGVIKIEVAVFIFAGFLESGKTTALQGALFKTAGPDFGRAVLICTEEGEEEYDTEGLSLIGVDVVNVDEESALSNEFFKSIERDYEPENVYIEFNGTWDLKKFVSDPLPGGWYIANVLSMVDASMYELYLKNMRQTIMTPLGVSDVILFNRCAEDFNKGDARRSIKLLNPAAEIYFTRPDGSIDLKFDEVVIDEVGGVLDIEDHIFCKWFADCIENSEKYYGKTVCFTAMVTRGEELSANRFYIGRYAIICCPEDATFVGFIAEYSGELPKNGDWIRVKAEIKRGETEGKRAIILLGIDSFEKVEMPEAAFLYY